MGEIIRFNTLTGLRPNECIAAVRLIRNPETFKTLFNEQRQTLEYFRFPQIYLRRTKSAWMSIITKEMLSPIVKMVVGKKPYVRGLKVQVRTNFSQVSPQLLQKDLR
jgi:hypothetical protein